MAKFKSNQDIPNAQIFITPNIAPYIKTLIPEPFSILKGENSLNLIISIPKDSKKKTVNGSFNIKIRNETVAEPLHVNINVLNVGTLEQNLLDSLTSQFGTSTPTIPTGQKFLFASSTPEIDALIQNGSDSLYHFKLGSVIFLDNLIPADDVASSIGDLLLLAKNKGIRTDNVLSLLPTQQWHRDSTANPVLLGDTQALTIPPHLVLYDSDGNQKADTLFISLGDTTHTILKPTDADEIAAKKFIASGALAEPAATALHELIHVLDFRTICGGAEWASSDDEETAVSSDVEPLMKDIFSNANSHVLNLIVDRLINQFPNIENCLSLLDLTRPDAVHLNNPSVISNSSIGLSWSQNADRDFASYRILRSTSSNVSLGATQVATVTAQSATSFTDGNLLPGTTYYYKVFVFDKAGLSRDSNEVSVNTSSPPPPSLPIWQMLGKNAQRTGLSPVAGPHFATSSQVHIKWQQQLNDITLTPPVIGGDGTVYVMTSTSTLSTNIYAFNGTTGVPTFITSIPTFVENATLSNDSSTLYVCGVDFLSQDSTLSAINIAHGSTQWRFVVGFSHPCNAPAVGIDGTIYTSVPPAFSAGTAAAVAVNPDGTQKWRHEEFNISTTHPTLSQSNSQVYVSFKNNLIAFTNPLGDPPAWSSTSPRFLNNFAVVDPQDRVFLPSPTDSLGDPGLLSAYSHSGGLLWRILTPDNFQSQKLTIAPDNSLFSFEADSIVHRNPANGAELNRSDPLPIGGVAANTVELAILDASSTSYVLYSHSGGPFGIMAVDNGALTPRWKFETPVPAFGAAMGSNGVIYFVTRDTIYALGN